MKYYILFFFLTVFSARAQVMHCGYDFTSYFVIDAHEQGKKETIRKLKITIIDSLGNDLININNLYSWQKANEPLAFTANYRIDESGKRLADGQAVERERWFFPFAKDNYLLSVANTFPADNFRVKIEDVDGKENGGKFKTAIIPLFSYNMYILCSNQTQQAAVKFGPKTNRPIDVVMEKE